MILNSDLLIVCHIYYMVFAVNSHWLMMNSNFNPGYILHHFLPDYSVLTICYGWENFPTMPGFREFF